ncbi:MAG: 4-hydroxythreonine-4-phosphate dehydrogenase PdxA [Bacteroidetes bacterium]|nr:4-hydroxythreonine-4-phosphate dehydrogenase PdxA [Bacteroidota bacterium]
MDNKLVKVGITQGDPNGIGLELIIRAFADENIYKYCIPVVYGSPKAFAFYKKQLNMQEPMYHMVNSAAEAKAGKLNLVVTGINGFEVKMGEASAAAGNEALLAMDKAIEDCKKGDLEALVTAPLDKSTVAENKQGFSGHTGYLANAFEAKDYAMLLISDELRIALVTEHIPLSEMAGALTQELVSKKINILNQSLQKDFGFTRPKIAVLGLNPHAGDSGLLGSEEKEIIQPAVAKAYAAEKLVFGPYPADGFFGSGQYRQFDAVLAMYHDQGLIPFKTLAFYDGVNFTAGLPIVRTSPDHGTAYLLAGKGSAEVISFRNAVYDAVQIVRNRKQNKEDYERPLPYSELRREKFRMDF